MKSRLYINLTRKEVKANNKTPRGRLVLEGQGHHFKTRHRTIEIFDMTRLLKSIANTLVYTQLGEFEDDDKYCTAVANNVQEARKLLETRFECICSHKDEMLFRKRK